MGRPTKPFELIEGHRTKDELQIRRDAELAMMTGKPMQRLFASKGHAKAAKEFNRLKELLGAIGKDDDLYSRIINLHCILVEECDQILEVRDQFIASKAELDAAYREGLTGDPEGDGIKAAEFYRLLAKLSDNIIGCDKQLMAKRKMLLDIDKENILTAQSALRSIPKKPEEKKKSGMAAFMEKRAQGGG